MGRPPRTRAGRCISCGRESQYIECDHRIPIRIGGDSHYTNLQDLCLDCHRQKTLLEASLFDFNASTETVREWFRLAFQDSPDAIESFIRNLHLRISHFEEVLRVMKPEVERKQLQQERDLLIKRGWLEPGGNSGNNG